MVITHDKWFNEKDGNRLSVLGSERSEAPAEAVAHRANCSVATNSARDALPEIDGLSHPR